MIDICIPIVSDFPPPKTENLSGALWQTHPGRKGKMGFGTKRWFKGQEKVRRGKEAAAKNRFME